MGQKSLSVLHRIDSSMTWDSHIFNKNYKWLSYNLWFMYLQFYKTIYFIDTDIVRIYDNLHIASNSFILKKFNNYMPMIPNTKRFSYYIDLYCLEFFNYILLINLYFLTDLEFFKKRKKRKKKIENIFF